MFSFYSKIIDPLLSDVRIFVPQFSGMKKNDKVLDVCCGTGDQVFYYGKKGILATGIDLNAKMIEIAKKRKERENLSNVSFQVADAKELPFPDAFFDFASISLALHEKEKEDRDKVISEMKRVVKKEGILVFIDFNTPLPNNLNSFLIKVIEHLAGGTHHQYFQDYLLQDGLSILLEKNNLQEEKREYLKGGIITIIKAKERYDKEVGIC